ncbi:hypothetical protein [Pseudoalteromonas aurantia]|uniref:Uncharacterized protein n=1 Tax=Pseudoalteromonas aurantia TaxID=43654 RepID=A0A5S3VA66_9GAMM|nr:hypothetical protein [Pseudoalteromonas aurantia]TMO68799.1 hypothetical protein CWC19_07720 [Pseudoalteromonas aurantia]
MVVPVYCSLCIYKRRLNGAIVAALFFDLHSVHFIGGNSWFYFPAPLSLRVAFGDFSDGQGYLFDYVAALILMIAGHLVWELLALNRQVIKAGEL